MTTRLDLFSGDIKNTIVDFFYGLQDTWLFDDMKNTTENSPWHREPNVLEHTKMVFDQYCTLVGARNWTTEDALGALAAIFHDVGKPSAIIHKHREDRGNYVAFPGHERVSARMWEDFAVRERLLDRTHIYTVGWMIEHHLPWELTGYKLSRLKTTADRTAPTAFINVLLADQYGRISDDQEAKLERAHEWVDSFRDVSSISPSATSDRTLYVLIGASGSGKSTFTARFAEADTFSLDVLRHEWYDPVDYRAAHQQSVDDKTFASRANQRFLAMLKEGSRDLIVDNTNLSRKRRAFYVDEARRRGLNVVGAVMLNAQQTLIDRQLTRGDKTVPEEAVRRQYMSTQYPLYGEFDTIVAC